MSQQLPLLFACSGCSKAGQLSDKVARELDHRGIVEMSCLAGVGAAKPHFLKKLAEREVWVIDGCPSECSLGVFNVLLEHIDVHLRLHDLGVRKHADMPTDLEFEALIDDLLKQAARQKPSMECVKNP